MSIRINVFFKRMEEINNSNYSGPQKNMLFIEALMESGIYKAVGYKKALEYIKELNKRNAN